MGRVQELFQEATVGDPLVLEGALCRRNGERLPVELQARIVEEEARIRILLLARGLTEARRTEVTLQEREKQLAKILAAARDAFTDHMRAAARGGKLDLHIGAEEGRLRTRADGREFPFEATLSGTEAGDRQLLLIILRDVTAQIQAENQLKKLRMETVYHREVMGLPPGGLVGTSAAMQKILEDIETVAPTDFTVLILGETGNHMSTPS